MINVMSIKLFLLSNVNLNTTASILSIILLVFGIIAVISLLITLHQVSIASKKIDYFYEDLAYKVETLNATIEAISRVTNYVEIFEAFSKRNMKSWIKVTVRNKDIFYKMFDRLKDFANGDD